MPSERIGDRDLEPQWGDIQGLILRGYGHPKGRHFVLHFPDASSGRKLITALVPLITTAAPWGTPAPPSCINIGFTADGLIRLGLNVSLDTNFSKEFVDGAIKRAQNRHKPPTNLGDYGDSGPEHWLLSLGTPDAAHAILSTWALDDAARDAVTVQVTQLFAASGVQSLGFHDADDLPDSFVHFGFRDSISQPNIDGAPMKKHGLDNQPVVATGEFLTGYANQGGWTPYLPGPDSFGMNGTYSAFRIMEQDVPAFFRYVNEQATRLGVDPEVIQANFCGRQVNGDPLATQTGPGNNDFDYADDPRGSRCPFDSHIRRSHPRSSLGTPPDGDGYKHRILRRALPYGPPWDADHPDTDSTSRGLIGHFIGASLGQQFEFVMEQWVNGTAFPPNLSDPLLGDNTPSGRFRMAGEPRTTLTGFARFTRTRGSAYLFLPGITGLRTLAH